MSLYILLHIGYVPMKLYFKKKHIVCTSLLLKKVIQMQPRHCMICGGPEKQWRHIENHGRGLDWCHTAALIEFTKKLHSPPHYGPQGLDLCTRIIPSLDMGYPHKFGEGNPGQGLIFREELSWEPSAANTWQTRERGYLVSPLRIHYC